MYSGAKPGPGAKLWARPGRPPVVAPDLSRLHGPTAGVIELPHRLFWQEDRHFDLDQPDILRWVYEIVLTESMSVAELETWLDGQTLARVWPRLFLPSGVLLAWELRYPTLRVRGAA